MMQRYVAIVLLSLLCSPAAARKAPTASWGKPGVSYDAYRRDAVACAQVGYYRDVSKDEPARRFVRGFRTEDDALNRIDAGGPNIDAWRDARLRTRPEQRMREIHAIQVSDVERCLSAKGYRRFVLSRAEEKALAKYRAGSIERHRFLYGLASR